jgi:integrase
VGVFQRKDSPFWYVWLDGAPRPRVPTKIPIGDTPEQKRENRKLAEQVYHQLMADRARLRFGLARELPKRTFAEQRAWYATHVSAEKRGVYRELSMLRQLGKHFDAKLLTAITVAAVREWRTKRVKDVVAATVMREEEVLKHLLRTAVPDYLEASPLLGLKRMRIAETDTRVLSVDEESRLMKALTTDEDKALVLLALDTLIRMSNARLFTRAQDHGSYLFSDTKVGAVKIPISSRLRAALDALPMRGQQYFPTYAGPTNNVTAKMFRGACHIARIPVGRRDGGVSFHCLRHTGATRMLAAGVDVKTVMKIGGWKNLVTMQRYLHPSDALSRAAVETIGAAG